MLDAGSLEDWRYHATYSGVPHGSICAPILANVLLHELDTFMSTMKRRFDQGKKRKEPPLSRHYSYQIRCLRGKGESLKGKEEETHELERIQQEIRRIDLLRKQLPGGDPFDDEYKRLYFCRYADDFCIGIIGWRADAEQIRQEVRQYIEVSLRLSIAEEKSHIRHSKQGVTFVGYELKTYSADRVIKLKRGTRHPWVKSLSEQIQLHIPQDKMQKFCAQKRYGNYATGKATHKPQWMNLTDAEIILAYNGEFRGWANYYTLAPGVKKTLHKLEWIWQTSLLKTLANKHKTGVNKIVKRLKTQEGLKLTVKREQETRYISVFRLKDLRKPVPHDPQLEVQLNGYLWTLSFSEVIKRLNRKQGEYCETTEGPFEVHHVRKLKEGAKGKAFWQRMMAARHRKTLVLCRSCHHQLHAGTLPDKEHLKNHVKGEPCASKGARTVLRTGDG
jgi:Type II intron maturase